MDLSMKKRPADDGDDGTTQSRPLKEPRSVSNPPLLGQNRLLSREEIRRRYQSRKQRILLMFQQQQEAEEQQRLRQLVVRRVPVVVCPKHHQLLRQQQQQQQQQQEQKQEQQQAHSELDDEKFREECDLFMNEYGDMIANILGDKLTQQLIRQHSKL